MSHILASVGSEACNFLLLSPARLSFIHALEICISAKPTDRSVMHHTAQHELAIACSKL